MHANVCTDSSHTEESRYHQARGSCCLKSEVSNRAAGHSRGNSPCLVPLGIASFRGCLNSRCASSLVLAIPSELFGRVDTASFPGDLSLAVLLLTPLILLGSLYFGNSSHGPPSSRAVPPVVAGDRHPLSILLVDDSSASRLYVSRLIRDQRHHCFTAENGLEAIDLCREVRFDLILMACHMPILDGYQAVRRIRGMERVKSLAHQLPIVALTANGTDEDREKCLQAGMDDYLRKPVDENDLVRMIYKWMRRNLTERRDGDEGREVGVSDGNSRTFDASELLQRCLGNVDLASQLLSELEATAPQRAESFKVSDNQCNLKELADSAHSLKGVAGILCAHSLAAAAARLELAAKAGEVSQLDDLIEQVTGHLTLCVNDIPIVMSDLYQRTC